MTSTRDLSFVKLTSNSANRARTAATNSRRGKHRRVRLRGCHFQLPQIPATHLRVAGVGRFGQPVQPAAQLRVLAGLLNQPPLVFPERDAGRKPFLRRKRDQPFPRIQTAMPGNGAKHLRHQVCDRLHVAQRRVRAAFGQAIILPQRLQLAVAGGHGIEQPLRQPQGAKPATANRADAQPLPLRLQHFVQIIFQIERDERQAARVFGKLPINLMRRFAVTLQGFSAGRLTGLQ